MSNRPQLTPFGKLVRKHRIDREMLLGTMADALGLSSAYISNIETGRKGSPKPDLVNKIADVLQLNPDARNELHRAAEESSKIIRFEVPVDVPGSDLVAAFARRFDHLTEEQLAQMRAILGRE